MFKTFCLEKSKQKLFTNLPEPSESNFGQSRRLVCAYNKQQFETEENKTWKKEKN